jgi:hypothetical protein
MLMLSGIIEFVPKTPWLEHLPAAYCLLYLLRCASAIFFLAEGVGGSSLSSERQMKTRVGGAVKGSTTRRKSFKLTIDNVQTTSSSHGRGQ